MPEAPGEASMHARADAADEDDRVFLAYCRRHRIRLSDVGDDELARRYAEALADRHLYPIPVSDPAFLYHGTPRARLAAISEEGLVPSTRPRTRSAGIAAHSRGRVFLTTTVRQAEFYARRASGGRPTVLLRVPAELAPDVRRDDLDDGSFFVERGIPPERIEAWDGSAWKALAAPEPAPAPSFR